MKTQNLSIIFFVIISILFSFLAGAQEENTSYVCKKYIDYKIHDLTKYNKRVEKQQACLIKKLKKKELRFAKNLKARDSIAYNKYLEQDISYYSIGKLLHPDSVTLSKKQFNIPVSNIDTLKSIAKFSAKQSSPLHSDNTMHIDDSASNANGLNKIQREFNYRKYINGLITQHTNDLKKVSSEQKNQIPGISGIEKQTFYGTSKMNVYKDICNNPSKIEDKEFEILKGTKGFDEAINKSTNDKDNYDFNSRNNAQELERMGYQTKQQFQSSLQKKVGKDISSVASHIEEQIKSFEGDTKKMATLLAKGKDLKHIKNISLRSTSPNFKINTMRGLPFWKRVEKEYNWQTTRPGFNGEPALLDMSFTAGFKHSPKLTYGLGVVSSTGLGQNWNNISISFQGIGVKTFITWKWLYGISGYGGYERIFKQAAFVNKEEYYLDITSYMPHNTNKIKESLLLGLTKNYKINSNWNGSVQFLYDIWWEQKGLRSPIVLRFSTIKM